MPYDNSNSGVLFKNEKAKTDNHPVYKGSCEVGGVDYFVAAFVNQVQQGEHKGKKYLKLKYTPKDAVQTKEDVVDLGKPSFIADKEETDDIPF